MTTAPPLTIRRDTSLLVATPLYGGAGADYLRSVIGLASAAQRRGHPVSFAWVSNNPVIDRARNHLVGAFQHSPATHLLFVDGDVGFDPDEVLDLVELVRARPDLAVIGAVCPKRQINWGLVARAAKLGLDEGDPGALERFSGLFALDPLDPAATFRVDEPLEVARLSASLMLICREVIEHLCQSHPELRYRPDPQDAEAGLVGEALYGLFQSLIDGEQGVHLSDDYAFCHRARAAGYRIWVAPWMRTTHTGPARFAGTLADLAHLSAAQA